MIKIKFQAGFKNSTVYFNIKKSAQRRTDFNLFTDQPFTEPRAIPLMMNLESARYTITTGMIAIKIII